MTRIRAKRIADNQGGVGVKVEPGGRGMLKLVSFFSKKHGASVLSVVAIVVSVASAYLSTRTSVDTARTDEVREAYRSFLELNQIAIQNAQVGHLFALPDTYAATVADIIASQPTPSVSER